MSIVTSSQIRSNAMNCSLCLLASMAAFTFGCSNDFAPYSQLDSLRVLAVQSEPPNPLPAEPALMSALTFAPAGQAVSHQWSWCPVAARASDSYNCPLDESAAAQFLGAPVPPFDLGTAPTANLTNPFPVATLTALCGEGVNTGGYSAGIDCADGFPITVVLDVRAGAASLRAGFVVRLPASSPPILNRNPNFDGLTLGGTELVPGGPVTLAATPGKPLDLVARLAADAAELRSIPATEGDPGQRLERLALSWFADAGKFDKDRTVFIDGVAPLDQAAVNPWTAPKEEAWPTGPVTFHVVVRDDRGGVGWVSRQVQLQVQAQVHP